MSRSVAVQPGINAVGVGRHPVALWPAAFKSIMGKVCARKQNWLIGVNSYHFWLLLRGPIAWPKGIKRTIYRLLQVAKSPLHIQHHYTLWSILNINMPHLTDSVNTQVRSKSVETFAIVYSTLLFTRLETSGLWFLSTQTCWSSLFCNSYNLTPFVDPHVSGKAVPCLERSTSCINTTGQPI